MSMIHNCSALLGRRAALMCGTARFSTVRSMEWSSQGTAITARPIHARRPALGAVTLPKPKDAFESWSMVLWMAGGRPRVVFEFATAGGKIVAMDLVADPERLSELNLVVLDA